jgi:putative restriction endonuclease
MSELIKARIGQGAFRAKLIVLWGSCAVTGYKDLNLLVASHIKPWSVSSNSERLDVYNGLLLVPNLDKAFDSGFISFKESGEIMISPC